MNRFLIMFFLQFLVLSQMTAGQKIIRSSLSCFGSSYSENGFLFRQTAGQSSATDILKNENLTIRQGFQQAVYPAKSLVNSAPAEFLIAPNPANNMTQIRFQEEIQECVIMVRDLNGIPVFESIEKHICSKWLDISKLKPGIYIITVIDTKGRGSQKLIITR